MATETARKTFRLEDAAQTILSDKQSWSGVSENETLNRLLVNIPKQEKELQTQIQKRQEAEDEVRSWKKKHAEMEAELNKLTNALMLVGSYLNPLGK